MSDEPSKQRLAVVVEAPDPNRGPDVRVKAGVPNQWLTRGASIRVQLPRLAACAACEGTGCERCAGKGALPLRGMGDAPTEVEVHLSPTTDGRALLLRLPDLGPEPAYEGRRGCVLLEVSPQGVVDRNVTLVTMEPEALNPSWYPWAALFVALGLLVLVAYLVA